MSSPQKHKFIVQILLYINCGPGRAEQKNLRTGPEISARLTPLLPRMSHTCYTPKYKSYQVPLQYKLQLIPPHVEHVAPYMLNVAPIHVEHVTCLHVERLRFTCQTQPPLTCQKVFSLFMSYIQLHVKHVSLYMLSMQPLPTCLTCSPSQHN